MLWCAVPSIRPRVIFPSRKACSISRLFPFSKETFISGNFLIKEARTGGSTYWEIVVLAPNRSSPAKLSICRYAANSCFVCDNNNSPAWVSPIWLPTRSNNGVLYCTSNSWICLLMAGWLINNSFEAFVKLKFVATLWNTFRRKSINILLFTLPNSLTCHNCQSCHT